LQDPALKVMQIDVTTYKSVVQLSGFVDTPQMVDHAGVVAKDVNGVTSVQNDLIVK
jgi:osmotically-inducible protein OsmY